MCVCPTISMVMLMVCCVEKEHVGARLVLSAGCGRGFPVHSARRLGEGQHCLPPHRRWRLGLVPALYSVHPSRRILKALWPHTSQGSVPWVSRCARAADKMAQHRRLTHGLTIMQFCSAHGLALFDVIGRHRAARAGRIRGPKVWRRGCCTAALPRSSAR